MSKEKKTNKNENGYGCPHTESSSPMKEELEYVCDPDSNVQTFAKQFTYHYTNLLKFLNPGHPYSQKYYIACFMSSQ